MIDAIVVDMEDGMTNAPRSAARIAKHERRVKAAGGTITTADQQRAIERMERKARALQAEIDSFRQAHGDCRGLLQNAIDYASSAANHLAEMNEWEEIYPLGTSARQEGR